MVEKEEQRLYPVTFKSKTGVCLSSPPEKVYLLTKNKWGNTNQDEIDFDIYWRSMEFCPQCRKRWKDH